MIACLLFNLLATYKVTSGRVLTCDSVHSCRLNSAAPQGNQAVSIITWYPTQSHYAHTEPIYLNNAKHLTRKRQVSILNSSVWLDQISNLWGPKPRFPKMGDGCSSHSRIPSALKAVIIRTNVGGRGLQSSTAYLLMVNKDYLCPAFVVYPFMFHHESECQPNSPS